MLLITYATRHGSTQEVAEAIAVELRGVGYDLDLRSLDEMEDVSAYEAVVLGAPLYTGRWHPDARRFLKHHRGELAGIPVAIFALGPTKETEEQRTGSRAQLDRALAKTPEVRPAAVEIFGGVIDPKKLRYPFDHMPAVDIRDWKTIRAWAEELPAILGLRLESPAVTH